MTISDINKDGKKLRMAYLPQQIASFNAGFPSTVYEFVKSGRYPHKGWFRRLNKHDLGACSTCSRVCRYVGKSLQADWTSLRWSKATCCHCSYFRFRSLISLFWMSQRQGWMQGQPIPFTNSCTTLLIIMASLS